MELTLETYILLEDNGVFIHYIPEHYDDGTNLCFSIEFKNHKTQTGFYNDNHEFGDVYNTKKASLQLALWYLENPKRIELINSGYNNPEYVLYVNEKKEFFKKILK